MSFAPRRIVVHCSATREGAHYDARDIDRWHRARGFTGIGYHAVVLLDGTVQPGRPEAKPGAHVAGHNHDSLGICYIGGVAANGVTPRDTRTEPQRLALEAYIRSWMRRYGIPADRVLGHRELDRGKACPSFEVSALRRALSDPPAAPPAAAPARRFTPESLPVIGGPEDIRILQRRLNVIPDGWIGPKTWAALAAVLERD